MKRIMTVLALAACAATPAAAAAQWAGMPEWNSPNGGTGITISGDVGMPDQDARKGTAWGARASFGMANLTLSAGLTSWKPEGLNDRTTGVGATAGFRLVGGSLMPVAINLQAGVGTSGRISSGTPNLPKMTTFVGAVGVSTSVPTPGLSIEPYLSLGLRNHKSFDVTPGRDSSQTNFGFVLGANVRFGMLGLHLAYDSEKFDDGTTHGIFGLGAHIGLRAPVGM